MSAIKNLAWEVTYVLHSKDAVQLFCSCVKQFRHVHCHSGNPYPQRHWRWGLNLEKKFQRVISMPIIKHQMPHYHFQTHGNSMKSHLAPSVLVFTLEKELTVPISILALFHPQAMASYSTPTWTSKYGPESIKMSRWRTRALLKPKGCQSATASFQEHNLKPLNPKVWTEGSSIVVCEPQSHLVL